MYFSLIFQLQTPLSMTGHMAEVTLPSQSQVTAGGVTSTVIGWGYLFVSNQLLLVALLGLTIGSSYTISRYSTLLTHINRLAVKYIHVPYPSFKGLYKPT